MEVEVTEIECIEFEYEINDIGPNPDGYGFFYSPGETFNRKVTGIRVHTDTGLTGEWIGHNPASFRQIDSIGNYLIGKDALNREAHWNEMKARLRPTDRTMMGPVDIALWDIAGKHYGAPIHQLLGTQRTELPTYASTYFADNNGGLDSPEAYADFAEECLEMGYKGYKIHGWMNNEQNTDREIETIHRVGERVGDEMDLMLDPVCILNTYADALKVGRACDEQEFLWYEDPFADGSVSQHAHKRLRERLDTPLLLTGEMRLLEQKTDFMVNGATDFARASPSLDGGITGAKKAGHVAEGLGINIEYHITGPAARHLGASAKNTKYYELGLVHPDLDETYHDFSDIYKGDYTEKFDSISDDGTVPVPTDPGLGVNYDWSYIYDNQTRKRVAK